MRSFVVRLFDPVFDSVLRLSWQAALLVGAVLLVQWLARGRLPARWRYLLWLLVVARLLLPISAQSSLSVFNWVRLAAPARAVPIQPKAAPKIPVPVVREKVDAPEIAPLVERAPATIARLPLPPPPVRREQAPAPFAWREILLFAWLAGAAAFSLYILGTTLRAVWQVRAARPVDDPAILALFESCRRQMDFRARVSLRETALVKSPALFGVLRPRLLMPPGLIRHFSPPELRCVFLHELAHVRRRDVAMNWLLTLLQVIHWFNPALWFGFARMRADRELACDALAMSCSGETEARTYGLTIIKLLETFARSPRSPGLVGILENKSQMARRIRLIANFRPHRRRSLFAAALMLALAATGLTDAVRSSRAQSPKPPEAKPIRVTVLDAATGRPIPGAGVIPGYNRNITYSSALPPISRTDAQGQATLPATRQCFGVIAPDYASRAVDGQWGNPAPALPDEYTIRLERGETIGGALFDDAGRPLAGVRVEVRGLCDPRQPNAASQPVEEYPFYDPAFDPIPVTDENGRWTCPHFSTQMEVLRLDFIRPDGSMARFHSTAPGWKYPSMGGLTIELAAARRGELRCVFPGGVDVKGIVLDPAGKPLAGVKITETDRRFLRGPVSVTETAADGRFLLPNRDPHQILLTAAGPGLATNAQPVNIAAGMPELIVQMHPAAGLRVRGVDPEGRPIAGVRVNPAEFALGWSGPGDGEGRVEWPAAPVEPILYAISAEGYGSRVTKLAATGAEQTVTLRHGASNGRYWTIKAIDEAGRPVDRFRVLAAYWRNGGRDIDFDPPVPLGEGKAGVCEAVVPGEKSHLAMRLQVEARGLETYVSDRLEDDSPADGELTVTLHKEGVSRVALKLPDGTPAAGALLAAKDLTGGSDAQLGLLFYGEGPARIEGQKLKRATADDAGVLRLPATSVDAPALIVHENGFLLTTMDRLRHAAELPLQAWGRLEGDLTVNGRPKADQRLDLRTADPRMREDVYFQFIASTGRNGHFVVKRLPAGSWTLYCTEVSQGEWPQHHPVRVEIAAGQTTHLAYAADGRTVTGRVQLDPPDAAVDWKNDLGSCLLTRQQPGEGRRAPENLADGPAFDDFVRQEDYQRADRAYIASRRFAPAGAQQDTYQLEFDADGNFRAASVPPGAYQLEVDLSRRTRVGQSWHQDQLGRLERAITVPAAGAGEADAAVDLGPLPLAIAAGAVAKRPTVTLAAPTLDGYPVHLADYRGRWVLVTFSASWATPASARLEEIKKAVAAHGKDDRLAILNVWLDDDLETARTFAQTSGPPGTNLHLTGRDMAAITERLAIDELPTTLLVGPDGALLSRDLSSPRLQAALEAALPALK